MIPVSRLLYESGLPSHFCPIEHGSLSKIAADGCSMIDHCWSGSSGFIYKMTAQYLLVLKVAHIANCTLVYPSCELRALPTNNVFSDLTALQSAIFVSVSPMIELSFII